MLTYDSLDPGIPTVLDAKVTSMGNNMPLTT